MIDLEIQNKLRKRYNDEGTPLRKHQLKMLQILIYIDKLCKENNIQYWLSSGTCLGAVRHSGFIPWDDDVDIEMMREDFLKFQKCFTENEKYLLQTHNNDRYYYSPFHKVREKNSAIYDSLYKYRGVFVDVFCMEYVNLHVSQSFEIANRVLNKLYNKSKTSIENRISFKYYSALFLFAKNVFFLLIKVARVINIMLPNKQLRHTIGAGWPKNIRVKEEILPLTTIAFEGYEFPVPGNYDSYLSHMYGDYMSIPSEDKINPPHVQYLD